MGKPDSAENTDHSLKGFRIIKGVALFVCSCGVQSFRRPHGGGTYSALQAHREHVKVETRLKKAAEKK